METSCSLIVLALCSFLLPGCATAFNLGDPPPPRVFRGTKINLGNAAHLFDKPIWAGGHPPQLFLWGFVLVDTPLSLAADTVLLPVDGAIWALSGDDDDDQRGAHSASEITSTEHADSALEGHVGKGDVADAE